MHLDVADFGATLAIGAFLIVLVEFVLLAFYKNTLWLPFKDALGPVIDRAGGAESKSESLTMSFGAAAMLLALTFVLGMLIENVSHHFADTSLWLQDFKVLPREETLKTAALFGDSKSARFAPLALDLADHHLISRYGGNDGKAVEDAVIVGTREDHTIENKLPNVATQLYYAAKNAVYRDPSYYNELSRIKMRIDFSRSFACIGTVIIPTILILGTIAASVSQQRIQRTFQWCLGVDPQIVLVPRRVTLRRMVALTALVILLCWLGRLAFEKEATEYYLRVYGYFASLHDRPPGALKAN